MSAAKRQIRQIIADNNLNCIADVYSLLRDSFKDILQELMEAELDDSLGYGKNQKRNAQTSNKRNGHAPTRDIHDQIQELYGMELSAEMASKITNRILPEIKEWQSRPLNSVYPFVFMDCIHRSGRTDVS